MHTTILYAHPWSNSFNHAVLDKVMQHLQDVGRDYTLIDLYADGFNPVVTEQDLAVYNEGRSADPMVARYNQILDKSNEVILIFPVWWYDMPAILRGFFDKVMLNGSAYFDDEAGIHPLRNMDRVIIYSTSFASTEDLIERFGDPINGTIINGTFKVIGFNNAEWHNLGSINQTTEEQRLAHLDHVGEVLFG